MTRRLNYWLMALLILIGVPFYWYFIDAGPDASRPKPVTMAQLRSLADAKSGERPVEVRMETIGTRWVMRNRLVSGWGLRQTLTAVRSYELIVPGQNPIVIDAGTSRKAAANADLLGFDSSAQKRVDKALANASRVILLQNTSLHNGGKPREKKKPVRGLGDLEPRAVAPGVVEIPATELGPRAKLVYAQLADGQEFLFTGPAAKVPESLEMMKPPARAAAPEYAPNYRAESKAWLMTINALRKAAPDMTVITAHDSGQIGHVMEGFSD